MSIIDPNSPGLFSFFAPKVGGPATYQGMEARRRIALQLLANSRKGYPKNIGEGLTAIGDAIGDRAVLNQLAQQESGYQQQAAKAAEGYIPEEARTSTTTPPPAPGSLSALPPAAAQPPLATSELTPAEREGGVVGSEANALDAAAPAAAAPAPTAAVRGVTPNAQSWYNFAVKPLDEGGLGFSPSQAAAKVANLQAESSSKILPSGVTGDAGTAHGAAQWRNDRYYGSGNRQGLLSFAQANGLDPNTTETQQKFMRYEYMGPEKAAYDRILATQTPQAAATAINRYYERSADRSGNREAIAARLAGLFGGAGAPPPVPTASMTPPSGPMTATDIAGADRLGEVTGMGAGDRGYASYAPTASLGREGDVQSDAPPITGISPNVGAAAADTVQQGRDAIARARMPLPGAPPAGPAGPAGPTAMAPPASGVVSDILPAPPLRAGAQLAQAPPPGGLPPVRAPLTDLPQREVPPPVTTGPTPPRIPLPQDVPMNNVEKQGWRLRAQGAALGDPNMTSQADALIQQGASQRKQEYDVRVRDYQDQVAARRQKELADEAFNRGAPERELARQQAEVALAKSRQFGGLSEEAVLKPVIDSTKAVAGIPQGQTAIRNALRVLPETFTGAGADVGLATQKLLAAAGFHADPRIAATEQFKAFIMPALAAARQAQSGGANISDNDMVLAAKAVAGDIKLDKPSIQGILEELQRVNVKAAIWHQSKVEAAAGDDPQRQAFMLRSYGLPMQELVDPGALQLLRAHPTADIMEQFNRKYHTPGLAQQILGGG